MKDYAGSIKANGKEYKLVFNLNVMEVIQDKYGSLDEWGKLTEGKDGEPNAGAVIFGFAAMINEGIDIDNEGKAEKAPFLTLKQVGRIVTDVGLGDAAEAVKNTVTESTKSEEKN